MMKQWLQAIVERADVPHGSQLFHYRITNEELDRVREQLQAELTSQTQLSDEHCAAFVLFGAEWFRQNYGGGPFSYATILEDGLQQPHGLVSTTALHEIIRRGLRWWGLGVPQINGRSQYLSGIVCQGGMPAKLLVQESDSLRAYLREVLHEHDYHRRTTLSAAESEASLLPQRLRNRAVHLWAATMVGALADLRKQTGQTGGEAGQDRIAYLDEHLPQWRSQIPQRLDEPAATSLVESLLHESRAPTADDGLHAIETRLSGIGDHSRIIRRLSLSATLTVEQVRELFDFPRDTWEASHDPATLDTTRPSELPHRFQIYLDRDGILTPVGVASLTGGDDPNYRISVSRGEILDQDDSHLSVGLAMMVGSTKIAACDAPGGDELPELAWSFEAEPPYRLLGTGQLKTQRPAVLLAAPRSAQITPVGAGEAVSVGHIPQCDRRLFRVRGEVHVEDDGQVTIATSVAVKEEAVTAFHLRGERMRLGHHGTPIWRGVPQIECWQNGAKREDLKNLQYRRGDGEWRPMDQECLGDVQLRQLTDDHVAHRVRLIVAPTGFRWQTLPAKSNYGVLRMTLDVNPAWQVEAKRQDGADIGVDIKVSRIEEQIDVTVTHDEARPKTIQLSLCFGDEATADVDVGCPTAWSAVVNRHGEIVPRFSTVSLAHLRTYRLQAITVRKDPVYALSQGVSLNRFEQEEHQQFEIPLAGLASRLEGMLTGEDSDETVELEFSQLGLGPVLAKLSVAHHLGSVEVYGEEDNPLVAFAVSDQLLSSLGNRADCLELELCPLGYPEPVDVGDAVQVLPRDALPTGEQPEAQDPSTSAEPNVEMLSVTGAWQLDTSKLAPGPWLAVVWTDPAHCLRPVRVHARTSEVADPPADMREVDDESIYDVIVAMRGKENRRLAWDECVARMATDLEHPAWRPMHGLLKASRRFPVTTFQAVAAMSRNPTAMALVGLQYHDDELWARLEQLPFLWSLIPVASWRKAAELWREHFEESLGAIPVQTRESTIRSAVQDFALVATAACPVMNCVLDCLTFLAPSVAPPDSAAAMRLMDGKQWKEKLHNQWQQLRRSRPGSQWPGGDLQLPGEIEEEIEGLLITEAKPAQRVVAKAPLAAAAYCLNDALTPTTDQIRLFQNLRGFEPEWFDRAQESALYWLARGYLERLATA